MVEKRYPIRKCIACASRKPKHDFFMIVRPPKNVDNQNIYVTDGSQKKDGRGAYICKDLKCILKAEKSHRIEKIFKKSDVNNIYTTLKEAVQSYEQ